MKGCFVTEDVGLNKSNYVTNGAGEEAHWEEESIFLTDMSGGV